VKQSHIWLSKVRPTKPKWIISSTFSNLSSPIQPYQSILAFLLWRNSLAKSPLETLFIDESNKPVTHFSFQKYLKSVLQLSGIPVNNFSSHSFRIRAATSAAQKGLSQQQISSWEMFLRCFPKLYQDQPVPHLKSPPNPYCVLLSNSLLSSQHGSPSGVPSKCYSLGTNPSSQQHQNTDLLRCRHLFIFLDTDLHIRVFLGCRDISCAVCRSLAHFTISCLLVNPSSPPCPVVSQGKSTSYVPRPVHFNSLLWYCKCIKCLI